MSDYRSVFRPDLFADQLVIVTGGGSGIGRCIAHEFGALGAKVVIIGRKIEKLEKVQAELSEDGVEADFRSLDIREVDAVESTMKELRDTLGIPRVLVNNAGGQFPSPAELIRPRGFDSVIRTNLTGTFNLCQAAFRNGMEKEGGSIVNIVADVWRGMPGMAHSGAARAGVINLTMTLAVEWARCGIRVNSVAPGWIASSGLDTYEGPVKAIIPQLKKSVPLKRMGLEAEVSSAVCFLASPGAAYITGSTLRVDGGSPLYPQLWPCPDHEKGEVFDGFHRAHTPAVLKAEESA